MFTSTSERFPNANEKSHTGRCVADSVRLPAGRGRVPAGRRVDRCGVVPEPAGEVCAGEDDRRRPGHLRLPARRHAHGQGYAGLSAQGGAARDSHFRARSGNGTHGFGDAFRGAQRLGLRAGEEREHLGLRRRPRPRADQAARRETRVARNVQLELRLCGMAAGHDALPEGVRQRLVPEALSRAVDVSGADSLVAQGRASDGRRRQEPERADCGNHLL